MLWPSELANQGLDSNLSFSPEKLFQPFGKFELVKFQLLIPIFQVGVIGFEVGPHVEPGLGPFREIFLEIELNEGYAHGSKLTNVQASSRHQRQ